MPFEKPWFIPSPFSFYVAFSQGSNSQKHLFQLQHLQENTQLLLGGEFPYAPIWGIENHHLPHGKIHIFSIWYYTSLGPNHAQRIALIELGDLMETNEEKVTFKSVVAQHFEGGPKLSE